MEWKEVFKMLSDGINSGVVQPLPTTIFPATQPEEAFRYMAQGKHVGKVLLQIRQEEPQLDVMPKPERLLAVRRSLPHPDHVYLITGGLGGFGLELAQWLINRGAKK